jgi:hypothetical protein
MIRSLRNGQVRLLFLKPSTKREWVGRLFSRLSPERWRRDHNRALSNLDWVIQMLHRVREEKPTDLENWWSNLRSEVLRKTPLRARGGAQTRPPSSTKL